MWTQEIEFLFHCNEGKEGGKVNKKDIESFVDGVIIIGATSGRNKIYFSGSQKPSISEAPYIDIENYEIDGFIIDGGTW